MFILIYLLLRCYEYLYDYLIDFDVYFLEVIKFNDVKDEIYIIY